MINYFLTGTGTLKSRVPILLVEIDLVLSGHYLKAPMIPQGRKFRVVVSIIHPTIFGQMFAVWFEHVLSIRPFISLKDIVLKSKHDLLVLDSLKESRVIHEKHIVYSTHFRHLFFFWHRVTFSHVSRCLRPLGMTTSAVRRVIPWKQRLSGIWPSAASPPTWPLGRAWAMKDSLGQVNTF